MRDSQGEFTWRSVRVCLYVVDVKSAVLQCPRACQMALAMNQSNCSTQADLASRGTQDRLCRLGLGRSEEDRGRKPLMTLVGDATFQPMYRIVLKQIIRVN